MDGADMIEMCLKAGGRFERIERRGAGWRLVGISYPEPKEPVILTSRALERIRKALHGVDAMTGEEALLMVHADA